MKEKTVAIFIIAIIIFIIGGCTPASEKKDISDIEIVNKLFELKDTYIGDASKVRAIIDLANNTEYKVENIELKTDVTPFRITVNFAVDNRANYRYIDKNGLNRISGLIFALVPNADEISYYFYDDFADRGNPENAFSGSYYTKENLCERISSDKITTDYIEKSTDTIKMLEEYYKTIMATEVAVPNREYTNKVYEFIGDDYEILVNSSIGAEIELDEYNSVDFEIISEHLPLDIEKYQGAGITANLTLFDVRNFKTGEVKKCVFLHYVHPDEGVIMIEADFVDRERYNKIFKLIMKAQTGPILNQRR